MIVKVDEETLEQRNITGLWLTLCCTTVISLFISIVFGIKLLTICPSYIIVDNPVYRIDSVQNILVIDANSVIESKTLRKSNIPTYLNNPGALRPSSIKEVKKLSIGKIQTPTDEYLAFYKPEHGFEALEIVIRKVYWESTVESMIIKFTPYFENDTDGYINSVCSTLKCTPQTKVKEVDIKKLKQIIAKIEGFKQ